MHDLLPSEGFMEVHESLSEMIRHVANEPSVGLFFVQQHAHKAVPTLVSIKDKVADTTQDSFLRTEDMNDAISSVKSMKECALPIIERMIKNLNSSVSVMSSMNQLKGKHRYLGRPGQSNLSGKVDAIQTMWGSAFQKAGRASRRLHTSDVHQVGANNSEIKSVAYEKCGESTEGLPRTDLGSSSSSFRSVFKTALRRAGTLGRSRTNMDNASDISIGILPRSSSAGPLKDIASSTSSHYGYAVDSTSSSAVMVGQEGMPFLTTDLDNSKGMEEGIQLPISYQVLSQSNYDNKLQIPLEASLGIEALELNENSDQFQSECVAKLEGWLSESNDSSISISEEHDLRPIV